MCAKIEGEACGGPGGFSGACEFPLKCITKPPIIGTGVCLGEWFHGLWFMFYDFVLCCSNVISNAKQKIVVIFMKNLTLCKNKTKRNSFLNF